MKNNMKYFYVLSLYLFLTGCVGNFGLALLPEYKAWSKPNYSQPMVENDLEVCRKKANSLAEKELCMLNLGYVYDDAVDGYFTTCYEDIFINTPGCRSMMQRKYEK